MNITMVFPGVGSQYTGMGKMQYDQYQVVRDTFDEASEAANIDLAAMCFDDVHRNDLEILSNSQLCVFTLSVALFRLVKSKLSIVPNYCSGYSLGEYSALCSSGAIGIQEAIKLIEARSYILQKITDMKIGSMMWVINIDVNVTQQICKDLREEGHQVFVSGYNSINQTAVSLDNASLDKAIKLFEDFGAIVIPLKISGPYHCPLMNEAADYMEEVVKKFSLREPVIPVIANWNSSLYEPSLYRKYLVNQLVYPIHWVQTMEKIYRSKPDLIIEVGPKEVLTYISRKINDSIPVLSMDTLNNFERICDYYENNCLC